MGIFINCCSVFILNRIACRLVCACEARISLCWLTKKGKIHYIHHFLSPPCSCRDSISPTNSNRTP